MRHAVAVGEGLCRLGLLAGGPALSLFDMLLATTGGEVGFENLISPCVVCSLRWFICLLGHGSFHFVPCFPPFFLDGRVSSMYAMSWHLLQQNMVFPKSVSP